MKPTLYFIPGTMCDERLWQDVWPLLPSTYHCVHLAIPKEHSIDAIIESFSKMLPTSGVNLIGFSLGGYLASQFACRYPQRLTTLMIIANAPKALPSHEITRREAVIRWVERHGYDGVPDRVINDQLHRNHKNNQHMLSKIKAMDAALGERVLLQQLKATSARCDLFSSLKNIQIPMAFCSGDQDKLVDASPLKHFVEQSVAQNSVHKREYIQVAGCGHMMPLEQPKVLANLILNWLVISINSNTPVE